MRLLVLLLLCISSVVLVEGGRRRRRWISRRRRRWNPVKAIKKVVRCPTSWWKIGGVNFLKYEKCSKFTMYWQNIANQLARPFGNFGHFIWQVIQDAGKFFRNMNNAVKEFFKALGDKTQKMLEKGFGGFVRGLNQAMNALKHICGRAKHLWNSFVRAMSNMKKQRFAEVESERTSSGSWWSRNSPNICSNSSKAPNSIISFWDCGINKAFSRHMRGPRNIGDAGGWLRAVGSIFSILGRKLRSCVVPHKKACGFGQFVSCFPFVAVHKNNLCFFKLFRTNAVDFFPNLKKKIERSFQFLINFFQNSFKHSARFLGWRGFAEVSASRSNAGDCYNNATRTYRNYFGFEIYFDLMPMLKWAVGPTGPSGWFVCFSYAAMPFFAIGLFMACLTIDIFVIFIRFGSVSGKTCGHYFSYGWCCPMWVFAGEWNVADLKEKFIFRDDEEYLEKLEAKITCRLCLLPRWGVGWNDQSDLDHVRRHGNSVAQFGMCHGPGFKILISDGLAIATGYLGWLQQPINNFATGLCIILGFNWMKGGIHTYFFALFAVKEKPVGDSPEPEVPFNIMYDLWCGYIDICFSHHSACNGAVHWRRGGRRWR